MTETIQRHRSLRWLGFPMLTIGLLGVVAALGMAVAADGRWSALMLYIGASGLSLATFGTHNDTAIALMARHPEDLPRDARSELEEELTRDKAGTLSLKATPRTAWVITVIAMGLHAAALSRMVL